MQRDPGLYREAARLLWGVPPERLSEVAAAGSHATQSVRDAAHMALGAKREFLDPTDFGSEEAALDRLAANLAMLPDFSLQEIASASGRPIEQVPPAPTIALEPKGRTRRGLLRVAVTVMVLFLALEALAQAGVPIPSPITTVVNGLRGEPRSIDDRDDRDAAPRNPSDYTAAPVIDDGSALLRTAGIATQRTGARAPKPKNENHARGRRLHFAQGRDAKNDKPKTTSRSRGKHRGRRNVIGALGRSVTGDANRTLRADDPRRQKRGRGRSAR